MPQFIFHALEDVIVKEFDGSAAKPVNFPIYNQAASNRIPILPPSSTCEK